MKKGIIPQQDTDYTQQIIESGESIEKDRYSERLSLNNDYQEFKKAKVWKVGNSIFSNVADLDIKGIGGRAVLADRDNNNTLVAPSGGGLWKFSPSKW
jgi:hypothetical protein